MICRVGRSTSGPHTRERPREPLTANGKNGVARSPTGVCDRITANPGRALRYVIRCPPLVAFIRLAFHAFSDPMAPNLPAARKEDIVRLSATHSNREIAALLGTTPRSCQRVLKLWRTYRVVEKPRSPLHGRPRKLTSLDVEVRRLLSVVCFSCELCCTALQYLEARLEREPDMYMSELRDALISRM